MLAYTFRPIEQWPGSRTMYRQSSKFSTTYGRTLDLLERELKHLGAKQIVIQADCDLSEIKNDGMLRSNARLRSPGVILSFESKHGPLSYPCDKYSKWEDNIRAIALSLEALRTVDRYGVTRRAEQYKGWARLPSPATNGSMSVEAAAEFIGAPHFTANDLIGSAETFRVAYRYAAARLHPDRNNGDDTQFKRLQEAKAVLEGHHGI